LDFRNPAIAGVPPFARWKAVTKDCLRLFSLVLPIRIPIAIRVFIVQIHLAVRAWAQLITELGQAF
jgi:hypothetical protein